MSTMTATLETLELSEISEIPGITRPMTYEEYLRSPEERARYDILEGYKVYRRYGKEEMASPTRQHQNIQGQSLCCSPSLRHVHSECQGVSCPLRCTHPSHSAQSPPA